MLIGYHPEPWWTILLERIESIGDSLATRFHHIFRNRD